MLLFKQAMEDLQANIMRTPLNHTKINASKNNKKQRQSVMTFLFLSNDTPVEKFTTAPIPKLIQSVMTSSLSDRPITSCISLRVILLICDHPPCRNALGSINFIWVSFLTHQAFSVI